MNLRRIILGEKKAYHGLIKRAINHALSEGEIIRSQDKAVYNFLKSIYEGDRKTIRRKYKAYAKLRDYKLKQLRSIDDEVT